MAERTTHVLRALNPRWGGFVRTRQLESLGLSRTTIRAMAERGELTQVARGLYRRADAKATEHATLLAACRRVPRAIVCLLTALRLHDIGTQNPHQIWLAIPRDMTRPRVSGLPIRFVQFSATMMTYGVLTRRLDGVSVSVTSPARTIVDCFRLRRHIGLPVAAEALRDAWRKRLVTVDELLRTADKCRIRGLVGTYVEAVVG